MSRPHKNSIWLTRLDWNMPYQQVNTDGDLIEIGFWPGGGNGIKHRITRADARLLAKRINQCLDATVKK